MAPRPRKTGSKDLPPNLYRKTDARNGITYYTYRDPITGRMFGLGKDKEAAIREAIAANHADAIKPLLTDRLNATTQPAGRLFSDWLVEYRQIYADRKLSASSNRNVNMRINRLDTVFGKKGIKEITTMDVADYLTAMTKEGKAQMARAMRSLLRDIFVEAQARGWANTNPVQVTKAARVTIQRERLTLDLWKAIYAEAQKPWLRRAMELAVLTGQRRDDIAAMLFKDVHDGFLHVIQSKTGARLRINTALRLNSLGLDLATVIKQCRDHVLSQHLVHHSQASGRAKTGQPLVLDTLSSAFAEARDNAAAKLGITFERKPPSFHEQRSLAARLHEIEGRDPQKLLGHRSAAMTDLYRDSRGAEWIDVA
ncbi:integrase [Pseudomonas protegens]|uniref:Integrase n=1 Tax=Pseudomonas protegens TaxID=380021 RepID=A0A2T6GBC3_9PSED|nr:phage integrase Arm DNA-binding domain-containing protein [Pseudomonas protegens]PUA41452.1 integrase [Pseudomonas protegens]